MNKYPLWKYILVLIVMVIGFVYTLPNFYGEDPAVQIPATRGAKLDPATQGRVDAALRRAGIAAFQVGCAVSARRPLFRRVSHLLGQRP